MFTRLTNSGLIQYTCHVGRLCQFILGARWCATSNAVQLQWLGVRICNLLVAGSISSIVYASLFFFAFFSFQQYSYGPALSGCLPVRWDDNLTQTVHKFKKVPIFNFLFRSSKRISDFLKMFAYLKKYLPSKNFFILKMFAYLENARL